MGSNSLRQDFCCRLAAVGCAAYKPHMSTDIPRHAPATLLNRDPILGVLRDVLPQTGRLLEIASGTGEHARYFAEALPGIAWQPSDLDPEALGSIQAHRGAAACNNIADPIVLDVTHQPWPVERADAMLCVNMIHIAPWECCEALLRGAGDILATDGPLVLYGPYKRDGAHTAPSNEAFDQSLRAQNPSWGVRDMGDIERVGNEHGLRLDTIVPMPSNNFCLILRRNG